MIAVLDSGDALTTDYVSELQTSQKGFHAIGFLLFGTDSDKALSAFTPRELEYLTAIGPVFDQTANDLLLSWTEGIQGNPAFRSEFINAGDGSNLYPTIQSAGEEIVQGIIGILDELGNVKIGEAYDAQNPFLLESRFAQSSLQDFKANMRSAQNAYLGDLYGAGSTGPSLSDYLAEINPALDASIREKMQISLANLETIPGPIEQTLCGEAAQPELSNAQDSVVELFELFQAQVLPLVQQ